MRSRCSNVSARSKEYAIASATTTTGARRPTLHDVAETAGVAVSTVSRYLNGQLSLMPDTETRILAAMEKLNFSRTTKSSRGKSTRPGVIGLIVPQIGSTYFARLTQSIVRAADGHGLAVIVASTLSQARKQVEYVEMLAARDVVGIIYAGNTTSNSALSNLVQSGLPVVVIDEALVGGVPIDTVVVDDYAGAYQATAHLTSLGHERIALVTGPSDLLSVGERARGYRDAMLRAGLDPTEQVQLSGAFSEEFGVGVLSHLLAAPQPPTAVFAASDTIALGIVVGARNLGVRIPEDLSIVGFDDTPEAALISPRLTTVRTPLDRMAASALTLLAARIEDPSGPAQTIVTAVALVMGDSSEPPTQRLP